MPFLSFFALFLSSIKLIFGLKEFFFSESSLVFFIDEEIELFNYFTKASKKEALPEKGFIDLYFAEDKLYFLKQGQLKIFTRVK